MEPGSTRAAGLRKLPPSGCALPDQAPVGGHGRFGRAHTRRRRARQRRWLRCRPVAGIRRRYGCAYPNAGWGRQRLRPEIVIPIHSTSSETTTGTRWDIDEDTGMLTAATPATVSMDTDDLHRVVMAPTRRGRLAVLGFADTVSSRDASHLIASGSTTSMGVYSAA